MSRRSVTITLSESDAQLALLGVMYLERDRRKAPQYAHLIHGAGEQASYLAAARADAEQLRAISQTIRDGLVAAAGQPLSAQAAAA